MNNSRIRSELLNFKVPVHSLRTRPAALMTISPIKAVSIPNETAIIKGAKDEDATISMRIRYHIMPSPSLTGMAYATKKANGNPTIDPTILRFLSLKIAYKITNEILRGINTVSYTHL